MRACSTAVILAILALFTAGLRAPSLPSLEPGHDSEAQLTAYRAAALPALAPARHGAAPEAARKAPCLAILPCCPIWSLTLSFCGELTLLAERPRSRADIPRTSRGPPSLT